MPTSEQLHQTLQSVFGFPGFRPGQEDVVVRLLEGEPVLAIFPTGAGKSMCYQLPALLLDGLTLVISPLIALMKDQIDFLVSRGVQAARMDSTLGYDETLKTYANLRSGKLKLLYVAPERLANERFLQTLRTLNLSLIAVDEAHCISEWGHNFRPDYMKLAALAQSLGVRRVLALTATATPAVAADIAKAFDIKPDHIIQTGFYRPNLALHISPSPVGADRQEILLGKIVSRPRGSTIVYVTLQRTADEVANFLTGRGIAAEAYHAGLEAENRHAIQDWFMREPNAVVVATIAFGMGIDKSDIRYVYHYNLPKSLENYAQEIGRSGRDGLPAICDMLGAMDDVIVLENFTFGDTPTPRSIRLLLDECFTGAGEFSISMYESAGRTDVRPMVIETILTYLELDGLLESTGPYYTDYKFQQITPLPAALARFDKSRAEFLRKLFSYARLNKTWAALNLDDIAAAMNEPRNRLVSALAFLETQGIIKLEVAGARRGYRVLQQDADKPAIARGLIERFARREARDIERLHHVIDLITHNGCLTRFLLHYFGEDLGHDCGSCSRCQGEHAVALAPVETAPLGEAETQMLRELRDEKHAALGSIRQVARFLCGIASPAATRAKLPKHPYFGALARTPFREVLKFVEGFARGGGT